MHNVCQLNIIISFICFGNNIGLSALGKVKRTKRYKENQRCEKHVCLDSIVFLLFVPVKEILLWTVELSLGAEEILLEQVNFLPYHFISFFPGSTPHIDVQRFDNTFNTINIIMQILKGGEFQQPKKKKQKKKNNNK